MAYYEPLGIDVSDLIAKGGPAIKAAAKVVEDPALPEVTCNILRLNKVVEGKSPGPACRRQRYTKAQKRRGVGLHLAVTPLRLTVWARQHPALAIGAGVAVLGALVGVGYWIGRSR